MWTKRRLGSQGVKEIQESTGSQVNRGIEIYTTTSGFMTSLIVAQVLLVYLVCRVFSRMLMTP
jgi:hypothetical protein